MRSGHQRSPLLRQVLLPSMAWLGGWGTLAVIPWTHTLLHPLWVNTGLTESLTLGLPATLIAAYIIRQSIAQQIRSVQDNAEIIETELKANNAQQNAVIDNLHDCIRKMAEQHKGMHAQFAEREERYMEAAKVIEHFAPLVDGQRMSEILREVDRIPQTVQKTIDHSLQGACEAIQAEREAITSNVNECIRQQSMLRTSIHSMQQTHAKSAEQQQHWVDQVIGQCTSIQERYTAIEQILINLSRALPKVAGDLQQHHATAITHFKDAVESAIDEGIGKVAIESIEISGRMQAMQEQVEERSQAMIQGYTQAMDNHAHTLRDQVRIIEGMDSHIQDIGQKGTSIQQMVQQIRQHVSDIVQMKDTIRQDMGEQSTVLRQVLPAVEQASQQCLHMLDAAKSIPFDGYTDKVTLLTERLKAMQQDIERVYQDMHTQHAHITESPSAVRASRAHVIDDVIKTYTHTKAQESVPSTHNNLPANHTPTDILDSIEKMQRGAKGISLRARSEDECRRFEAGTIQDGDYIAEQVQKDKVFRSACSHFIHHIHALVEQVSGDRDTNIDLDDMQRIEALQRMANGIQQHMDGAA